MFLPAPLHQNPLRSGASKGTDAGCNALNFDSACSSRAAWHVAPQHTMHPPTGYQQHLLPRCERGAAGRFASAGCRIEPLLKLRAPGAHRLCELETMHLVHATGVRCPDIDHGSIHVDEVESCCRQISETRQSDPVEACVAEPMALELVYSVNAGEKPNEHPG